MGRMLTVVALLIASSAALAGNGSKAVRDSIEASMLVSGTIHVDAQGRVEGFVLDQAGTLPEPVARLLAQAIPAWRFEPTLHEGQPAFVGTSMHPR